MSTLMHAHQDAGTRKMAKCILVWGTPPSPLQMQECTLILGGVTLHYRSPGGMRGGGAPPRIPKRDVFCVPAHPAPCAPRIPRTRAPN